MCIKIWISKAISSAVGDGFAACGGAIFVLCIA